MKFLEKPFLPLAFALAVVVALWLGHTADSLNRAFFDFRSLATANPSAVPTNGVLVLIDENSLKVIGERYHVRWPWPRSLFGALIASLHQAGAKNILMDFEFDLPSEDSMQDDVLAAYSTACTETILARTREKGPVFWNNDFENQFPQFFKTPRTGLVDFAPDADGVYRHYWMADSLAARGLDRNFSANGLLLRWYAGMGTTNQRIHFPTNQEFSAAQFVILGEQLQTELRRKGFDDTNPTNILPGLADLPPLDESVASEVRGKVVFVGANASGTEDLKATPLKRKGDVPDPGVLIHFTGWANAERGDFIRTFPRAADLLVSVVLVFAVIVLGWKYSNAALVVAISIALELILFGASSLAFDRNYFFPPSLPAGGVGLALLASVSHNFWRESRRKREIQGYFGSYVSPEFVKRLVKNPEAIQLGGEKKELTVFFSDLAGFTDLSEKLPPEELVQVVNRYLAAVTDFILDNGGYVDKYIGDAVMGVFGSPEPLEKHAVAACRAAIASRDWMAGAFADSPVKLKARIGLNSGPMVVGNVGSKRKKNFTVLGDSVNLASRLEAANKEVGTLILIGEDTERLSRGQFLVRPVARLRVKGKQHPNQTYELICEAGKADAGTKQFVTVYSAAYESFLKEEFAAARAQFHDALAIRPDDKMAQLYLDRATKFEYETLVPGWDVLELKSK